MKSETHKRSLLKSILWRLIGVGVLAAITYAVTRSPIDTGMITFLHHFFFIWIYYLHERLWQKIGDRVTGRKRTLARILMYEIVLGNLVLGAITYMVTGSWTHVSLITPIYIGNKLWLYAFYDKIWSRIKWGNK